MKIRSLTRSNLVCLLLVIIAAGCGSDEPEEAVELPDWLSESQTDDSTSSAAGESPARASAPSNTRATLQLSLNAGDRIPFRKVVEQELTQSSLSGEPELSSSRLTLTLELSVGEVQNDRTLVQVRYDQVQYSQDVAGERVDYDSTRPPQSIPQAVLAYHGMVGDGFAFWIGSDNQISELVGFHEFVDRCLAHVPPAQRQQAMREIAVSNGQGGIADFVDNTIGLLPYDLEKAVGDHWEKSRHVTQPVPMQLQTVYTLAGVDEQTAEITIDETIAPSTPLGGTNQSEDPLRITVNGGSSRGHCVLLLDSGLPKESQLERIVDMTVQVDGGIEFHQQKRTVTTVKSFPQQVAANPSSNRRFQ